MSEEFVNFTMDGLSPLTTETCLKENHFGLSFISLVMALCFLVGAPAHVWCLWFYICFEQKIKGAQVFFLNHTVMEIIYSLECGVEILNLYIFKNDIVWHVLYFCAGLSWTGRALLQVCICIEQYLAVIHPVTFLRYKGIKYRITAAIVAWHIAFAYSIYLAITLIFPDIIYTFILILALSVILFCCVSVLCALKHPRPGDPHVTKQTGKDGGNQQKRKAFNTILSALFLILFTYLPQTLLVFFNGVDQLLLYCNISSFIIALNILGVIITPLQKMYKEHHQFCQSVQKVSCDTLRVIIKLECCTKTQ